MARWLDPSDRRAVGWPETIVDYVDEAYLGLHVTKTAGGTLGMLAIKCERVRGEWSPVSIAIADTPIVLDLPANIQTNVRRMWTRRRKGGQ